MTPTREMAPDGVYHVYNRGNNGGEIYQDDLDRHAFLNLIYKYQKEYEFRFYALCLMDNHYHFLIKDNRLYLPEYMNTIQSQYAQKYNKKYKKKGHLFEGPFKSRLVRGSTDLFLLMKYIVRNPIKAGITNDIGKYYWNAPSKCNAVSSFIDMNYIENNFPLWLEIPFWEFLKSDKDDYLIAKIEIYKKTFSEAKSVFLDIVTSSTDNGQRLFSELSIKKQKEIIKLVRYYGISTTHICMLTSYTRSQVFQIDYSSISYL